MPDISKIITEQIPELVNEVYSQMVGAKDEEGNATIVDIDLTKFVDNGTKAVKDLREQYTGAMLGRLYRVFLTQTSYSGYYDDPYTVTFEEYGTIMEVVSMEAPEVIQNSAWKEWKTGDKIGVYTVYLPIVDTKYYAKNVAWSLPITLSTKQWDDAVVSKEEFNKLWAYALTVVKDAVDRHRINMTKTNRNNFIAEKLLATEGINKINLIEEYAKQKNVDSLTRAEVKNDDKYYRYSGMIFKKYAGLLREPTKLFNTEGWTRHVPSDRLVFEIIEEFKDMVESFYLSDVKNLEFANIPFYRGVPFWQAVASTSYEDATTINVTTSSGTINKSGIVGLMCDKWAIMHTIKDERVRTQYFDIEGMVHSEYQNRDAYMNNLAMPAIVFVEEDYNKSAVLKLNNPIAVSPTVKTTKSTNSSKK